MIWVLFALLWASLGILGDIIGSWAFKTRETITVSDLFWISVFGPWYFVLGVIAVFVRVIGDIGSFPGFSKVIWTWDFREKKD